MRPQREAQLLKILNRKYAYDDYDAYEKRREAIDRLAEATSDRAFNRLVDVFTNPVESFDRSRSLDSLARMRPHAAVPYLLTALADEDPDLRYGAAKALGNAGAVDAAPLLVARLSDDGWMVRSASAEALGKLRFAPAVPGLIAMTRDTEESCRAVAAQALGEIATPEADAALLADHIDVQWVWPHLIRIGDRRVLPRMRKVLKQGTSSKEEMEWASACGEPSLEQIVRDWERRWRTKVRPKHQPARWGERVPARQPPAVRPWRADVIEQLRTSGWLEDVPAREAARLKRVLQKSKEWNAALLAPSGYDAECIENSGDYKRWVIPAYEKAAAGALKITNVREVFDDDNAEATLSFRVGRKAYVKTFDQPDDYVWDGLTAFMNKIVSDAGLKQRFYELATDDQIAPLVFVTPQTYARARRRGLI